MTAEIDEQTPPHDYIRRHWEILAACAWKEYQAHGRGALLIGAFAEPDDSIYLPLEMMAAHPLLEDVVQFAEEYDPLTEILVIFLRPADCVSAYKGRIPNRGTPPEVYERLKTRLQES